MIHVRPQSFIALYGRASRPDGRSCLTHVYVHSQLASGRWANANDCNYIDPLPSDAEQMCCGLERLLLAAHQHEEEAL